MSWSRTMFDVRWNTDKYRNNYDSEHWGLCRTFMEIHKTKYPEQKLVHLTEAFYQMGVYGSSYDPKTTRLVNALTIEVLDAVLKDHPGILRHPFDKSVVVVPEALTAEGQSSKEDKEPSQPSSIWDVQVDQNIIVNVLIEAQMKELFKGFVIIYDIRRMSTMNDNKVSILEESFKRSKFGPCHWAKDDTNNNICPIRIALKWRNVILAEAVGAEEKSLKTRLAQAVLSKMANFSSGIEAKWSYYRDGRLPDRFDNPNPRKSNIYRVIRRSQFKTMDEIISFIDTFANSDSFAEIVFTMDFSNQEKTQLMGYVDKTWCTKLTYRTLSKTGVKNKNESHVIVYHIRSGEELLHWLGRSDGENDRYRIVHPGKHRRAGTCDNNVREVLTTDAVELPKESSSRAEKEETEKKRQQETDKLKGVGIVSRDAEMKDRDTNKKDSKTYPEDEDDLEKLLDGFVLFYDANKTSEIDKDDWFTAVVESFKLSKFGALEVITENTRPLRTRCVFKWKGKTLASAEGLTETQAKTAATLQLISKLEPFTYIIQAKEEYFCGGRVPKFIDNPDQSKSDSYRIVRRKELPSYYAIFQTIDDFQRKKSFGELIFGSDFPWELKNEIVVYLKAKGLSHRYFTSREQKPWTHMAVYHTVKPEELKEYLLKNRGENEKYKLIPPSKAEPISDKTSQEKSTKEVKKPADKAVEKRKPQEPEPTLEEIENNKIQIKLKKFKVDKVEFPEDTGGDFPGLIIWIGIRKNSMWQKSLFSILLESFKMSKYGELLIEESEENVWGRKEPFKKCVIKSSRRVLAVGLGESKTEAKNSASLQVLRQLRKHNFTIQAKESYFKEGKATPYNFTPDPSKAHVYRLIKRNKFRDRAAIIKFVNDFSKNVCPEEAIFGDDFTYDEREYILDHCRKIDLNYRLMKCQSVSKNMHTHVAIFHQQPLPVIKAELMKAGGENDMYRLIPPGGKITNQHNAADLWPDTNENGKEAPDSETSQSTTNLPVQQNIISQSNEQRLTKNPSLPDKNLKTNQTPENSNPIPSLINRVPVKGPVGAPVKAPVEAPVGAMTLNFDQKGNDIDNFTPAIHVTTPDRKHIPIQIGANFKKGENLVNKTTFSGQSLQNQPMGPHFVQNQPVGPQPQIVMYPQQVQVPFQEVPFGPQPLYVPPPPIYSQPFMDTPLQFGPVPPVYESQLQSNMGIQPIVPQMEMGNQSTLDNVQMPTVMSQTNQTQIVVPSVSITVPNSPQKTDLREELSRKRQAENRKGEKRQAENRKDSPERKVYDNTTDRRVINTDDKNSDSWSRTVFVAEPQDNSKRDEPRNDFVGKSSTGTKEKPQDLREKLRQREPKKSGEPASQSNLPESKSRTRMQRRSPEMNRQRQVSSERNRSRDGSRERWRYRDETEQRIIRQRNDSPERRVYDSTRDPREDYGRTHGDRFRSRSRSPPRRRRGRSPNPYVFTRELWDNVPVHLAESIFMYKYIRQDSTMETDAYNLLRATRSPSFSVDFDFVKERNAPDEWYVGVELITPEHLQPLVGEWVDRTENLASLGAANHAVDTIEKSCRVIEPNFSYFCEGGVPDFIARKSPMKTSIYEIIQNLDPGTPLAPYTIETMLTMFISSDLEDIFFLATDFTYRERTLVVEMAVQMDLGWRTFGPCDPDALPEDLISTQHVCIYKQKSVLQVVRELIANGGSTVKYRLVDPREYRLMQPRRDSW